MSSLRTWFRGSSAPSSTGRASHEPSPAVSASTSTTAISASEQPQQQQIQLSPVAREIADMEDAMVSTALLLNDDIEGAETRLRERKDSSAFHQMGLGVATFMRSVLGFEKEFMAEANDRLLECESRAWEEMKKAQREAAGSGGGGGGWLGRSAAPATNGASNSTAVATEIYPPGSEFALVHAETQLMLAVVAQLHESLTEAVKGFYKLRKAFLALNAIIEAEDAYLQGKTSRPATGHGKRLSFSEDPMPGAFDDAEFADLEKEAAAEDAAARDGPQATPTNGLTTAGSSTAASATASNVDLAGSEKPNKASAAPSIKSATGASLETATAPPRRSGTSAPSVSERTVNGAASRPDLDSLTNPVDIFVHSGANMCFGLLLLFISMVPPAFSRVLSIVGFKGDRERGVRMLWQSTKFPNINGGMAGMVLLAYYNGLIAYSDILPADADIEELAGPGEIVGYPRDRCKALLAHMRKLYPDSMLWVLEEARLLSTNRQAKEAIAAISSGRPAKMRQIAAVTKFELAIDAMCVMDWPLMRDSFLACVELNNWSHALYYYNVGCAELELYRTAFHRAASLAADPARAEEKAAAEAEAAKHKKAAEEHLRKAPTMAGKKKFMARQMPFDLFVIRKLARWEERAKAHGIDLADAVGVSPAQEMVYLWNGSKRLSRDLLEEALTYLAWERCTADAKVVEAFKAAPDESVIGSVCRVNLLRSLGRLDAAQEVLDKEIFIHDRAVFKGPTKDDYLLAAGTYEAAVIRYTQACDPAYYPSGEEDGPEAVTAYRHKKIDESQAYLDKVAKWETFVLDARLGMRVQTGLDTIRWLKKKKTWA